MIIKTGVVLNVVDRVEFLAGGVSTILGDLHIVGNCCIMYYPANQAQHGVSHGWITGLRDPYNVFQRSTQPHCVLVVPTRNVRIRKDALDPISLVHFVGAGGRIDYFQGEMG